MLSSVRFVLGVSCLSVLVDGFGLVPTTCGVGRTTTPPKTQLYGRRVIKRGSLGSINSEDTGNGTGKPATRTPRRSTKQQRKAANSRKKKSSIKKSNTVSSEISPDLAKFLEDSSDNSSGEVQAVQKQKSRRSAKSERRQKQSAQKVVDEARSARIQVVLDELQEVLQKRTGNVRDILNVVEKLLKIPSNNNSDLRPLLSGRDRNDYRLAWVGSDEAICHLGTGLHKVPLARMQEVFMNCLGRNRIEILEVISLIGPFPNVKNQLQGTTEISTDGQAVQIVMDRMVDGTGKEIKSDSGDNIRRVDLEVAFSDERVILVVMPDSDNKNTQPLDDNGKRVLLFIREDDLDERLEELRVNEISKD